MVSVEQLRQTAEKHRIAADPEVQALLQKAIQIETTLSDHRKQRVLQYIKAAIDSKVEQKRQQPFPTPTPVNHWQPVVQFGETMQGTNLYLTVEQLAQHLGVFAQSKGGKTTFFREQMIQLDNLDHDVSWWATDFNQDYRHLANRDDIDVMVFPFRKLRLNPLKPPPGVSTSSWRNTVAEIFADSQALLDASENFSAKQLSDLYQGYKEVTDEALEDLYDDAGRSDAAYPTLIDLKHTVDDQGFPPGHPAKGYQGRVLNRLDGIIEDAFYTVDTVHGHDLEALLEENVVFEFSQPRKNIATFFVELLFAWVQDYRVAQNHGDTRLRHIWFKDELKNTHSVYKEKQVDSGVPVISDRFARIRNQGESVFGADQVPTLISQFILANTYVTMLGPMNDHTQFERVAKSMGLLEDPHQKQAAQNLDVGEFVVTVGSDGPYKITAPYRSITEDVTDEILVELYQDDWQRYLSGDQQDTTIPNQTSSDTSTATSPSSIGVSESDATVGVDSESQQTTRESGEIEVSDEVERLLEDIATHPFKPASQRYDLFSSTGKGYQIKNEALAAGLIEEIGVADAGTTRKLFEFTDRGSDFLDTNSIEIKRNGRGGVVHRYWQHQIKEMLESAGFAAGIEKMDIDVYGNSGKEEIAVEVAMGKNQREIDHIKDRQRRGLNVLVACQNRGIIEYLKSKVSDEEIDESSVEFQQFQQLSVEYFESLRLR